MVPPLHAGLLIFMPSFEGTPTLVRRDQELGTLFAPRPDGLLRF